MSKYEIHMSTIMVAVILWLVIVSALIITIAKLVGGLIGLWLGVFIIIGYTAGWVVLWWKAKEYAVEHFWNGKDI